MIATSPRIIPRLNILDPTTLPTEIDNLPAKAADIETANSGADVPMATTVRPITNWESPNFFAIREADSTTQTAPPQRAKTVPIIIVTFIKLDNINSFNLGNQSIK